MMATVGGQPPGNSSANGKLMKPRSRVVKPILKKLSHSEKNSLDLDRSWEDQPSPDSSSSHIWGHGWPGASDSWGYSSGARPARDVTFSLGTVDGVPSSSVRKYTHHARSTSGTSHHSHLSIATTSSGHRGGSFVHPFQQTPRTSTPPLGYANSLASFDNTRDYSPTITEDDDDLDPNRSAVALYASQQPQGQTPLAARSQSNLRRPSLASRTSSLSDVNAPQSVRVSTASRTSGKSISRLTHGLVSSRSDLNLNIPLATSTTDPILEASSPASVTSPASGIIAAAASASVVGSPTSSAAPMSPLRSSLDMTAFPRLRTNSEVSPATRAEIIRHERRKFAEKEDRKQKSWEQKMIRKREKDITREAVKKEQEATARARKNSSSNSRREILTSRSTGNLLGNSSSGRKKAKKVPYSARTSTDKTEAAFPDFEQTQYSSHDEKTAPPGDFQSRDYRTMPNAQSPKFAQDDEVHFIPTVRRRTTAKAKTHGAWTTFVLWMRTKLLRLSKSG